MKKKKKKKKVSLFEGEALEGTISSSFFCGGGKEDNKYKKIFEIITIVTVLSWTTKTRARAATGRFRGKLFFSP